MNSCTTTSYPAKTFGSTLASIFSRGVNDGSVGVSINGGGGGGGGGGGQQISSSGMTGMRLMSSGSFMSGNTSPARLQGLTGASMSGGGTLGTRMPGGGGGMSGRMRSGSLFSGLSDLIPGLGGGGGGGGGGMGGGMLPGLPPGMTMTQDGCICPMPKAKTKYIAVEVPKVIFVPPKEKTKIITIKEIIEKPASSSSYEGSNSKYGSGDDDNGVSFDGDSGY